MRHVSMPALCGHLANGLENPIVGAHSGIVGKWHKADIASRSAIAINPDVWPVATNVNFVRTLDLGANRSEGPLGARTDIAAPMETGLVAS